MVGSFFYKMTEWISNVEDSEERINIRKEVHPYNTFRMPQSEEDKEMEKHPMLMDWKNKYCEKVYAAQSKLHIQWNPYQNTMDIFQSWNK